MKKKIQILWEKNKRYILLFIIVIVTILFSISVYFFMDFYTGNNPFAKGEAFYENKEYENAKREYLIYLESSKYGLDRWKAWERLYYIITQIEGNLEASLSFLDKMKKEYKDNKKKEYAIFEKYLVVYTKQRNNKAIMGTIELILSEPIAGILSDDEKIQYYKEYSRVASVIGTFKKGIEFIKATMPQKNIPVRMQCLYELGTLYMGKDNYKIAKEYFDEVLMHVKKEETLGYMSIFLLGNMAVSRGDLLTAQKRFEEIIDIYPNKEVIELRLQMIEKMRSKVL